MKSLQSYLIKLSSTHSIGLENDDRFTLFTKSYNSLYDIKMPVTVDEANEKLVITDLSSSLS